MNKSCTPTDVMRSRPQPCCPLCKQAGSQLYENLPDRLFGAGGLWNLAKCTASNCGLIWMNPMPIAEDLGLAYQTYFTHDTSQESNLRKFCLRIYEAVTWLTSAFTGLYYYKGLMKQMYLRDKTPGKLLDVGCGDGRFLFDIKQKGWKVSGVEVDAKAVEVAKNKFALDVFNGDLFDANYESNSFDAVTLRHVIEHLPDPVRNLAECKRILKPGGRLVVVTPNTESWGHAFFKRHWLGLDQPRHLMIFSPNSIRGCAQMAGFEKFEIKTSPANAETVFAVSLSLVKRDHHKMDLALAPEPGRALKAVLSQHREALKMKANSLLGEELVLIAEK